MKGRIVWWSLEKGYGFIEYNKHDNLFAHLDLNDENKYQIKENQEIEFTVEERENGLFLKILSSINHKV